MKRRPTQKAAKAKAWKAFSIFIRTRDCLLTAGEPDNGSCYTCNFRYSFKSLQAGHFVPNRSGENLWDERGVHAQCYRCNGPRKGNWPAYLKRMLAEYGQTVVDELMAKAHVPTRLKAVDYLDMAELYKQRTAELLKDYERGKVAKGGE